MNDIHGPDILSVDVVTKFYVYREHFPFGDFTGYRTSAEPARYLFWYPRVGAVTGAELADILTRDCIQVSENGIRQAMANYAELRALP